MTPALARFISLAFVFCAVNTLLMSCNVHSDEKPLPSNINVMEPTQMLKVQGGCYIMGATHNDQYVESDEEPQQVCVKAFSIAAHEVSIGEYKQFVASDDYASLVRDNNDVATDACWAYEKVDGAREWDWRGWANWRQINQTSTLADNFPVACVSFYEALAYINWLNAATGKSYRLPTEAEWEYAARSAEADSAYTVAPDTMCEYANVADLTHGAEDNFLCNDGYKDVAPVGQFKANGLGLYDILGNVWEWTCSKHDPSYDGEEIRCLSPNNKANRASRGASWDDNPSSARLTNRSAIPPTLRISLQGFRLVLNPY
jgi:formylglycine-generating enzyme required for sulfatase activity